MWLVVDDNGNGKDRWKLAKQAIEYMQLLLVLWHGHDCGIISVSQMFG
jgi:hypothetical protein